MSKSVGDLLWKQTSTAYDAAGRAVATIDALGNRASTLYDACHTRRNSGSAEARNRFRN